MELDFNKKTAGGVPASGYGAYEYVRSVHHGDSSGVADDGADMADRIFVNALSENLGCFVLPNVNVCMQWGSASIPSVFRRAWDFGGVRLSFFASCVAVR